MGVAKTMVAEDVRFQVLSAHYDATFAALKQDVARRDRLFLYILILISTALFYISAPDVLITLLTRFVEEQLGVDPAASPRLWIDASFVGTVLWFGLLTLVHTYFQTVLHVERRYSYIYHIENLLSETYGNQAFIREGQFYRAQRRKFSSWTRLIFWILFPFFLAIVIAYRLYNVFVAHIAVIYIIANVLISVTMLVSLGLYLLALHRKK